MKSIMKVNAPLSSKSPSARREWVEMLRLGLLIKLKSSPSARREWVEIGRASHDSLSRAVSLREEGVG